MGTGAPDRRWTRDHTYTLPIEGRDEWLAAAEGSSMLALGQEFGVQFSEEQMCEMLSLRLEVLTLQELAGPTA